jgi:tRNA/tmRNA/rRNA uracil-C5-methylase (TrmA/RlmC/RlmD family)
VSFHVGETVEVTTEDVATGGWCVARPVDRPVIFVRHALPGERVVARVTEVTSRFARAEAVEILQPSPDRVEPPCPNAHPGGCGGCDWQHASLPAQRALKAAVLGQHLRRIAGFDHEIIVEPLPGDQPLGDEPPDGKPTEQRTGGEASEIGEITARGGTPGLGWRTRVQFAVRPDGVAGLRAHRSHEVIDIGDCPLAHPGLRDLGILDYVWEGASMVEAVIGSAEPADPADPTDPAHAYSAIILTQAGRHAPRGRQAPGTVPGGAAEARVRSGDRSVEVFPEEAVEAIEAEAVLIRTGHRLTPLRGRPYLTQQAAGRQWRVSAGAFWQVHPAAADTLTEAVVSALEPKPGDAVLDLYCGAGLFAGAIAPLVGKDGEVIGIESDDAAVRDARDNLRDYPWTRVVHGDVARAAAEGNMPSATLVVADPPRAGLAREIVDYLTGDSPAKRFAYVSCDPATFARDLSLLTAGGWRVDGLRAFDAFPMTHHVECVATLTRLALGRVLAVRTGQSRSGQGDIRLSRWCGGWPRSGRRARRP